MTIEELKRQVEMLSIEDFCELRLWMNMLDDDDWDRQMRADAGAGKLDFLEKQVREAVDTGRLYDVPTGDPKEKRPPAEPERKPA